MKKLIVTAIVCTFLAGISLTATVGCSGEVKKTEASKKTEPETKKEGDMPK